MSEELLSPQERCEKLRKGKHRLLIKGECILDCSLDKLRLILDIKEVEEIDRLLKQREEMRDLLKLYIQKKACDFHYFRDEVWNKGWLKDE